MTLGLFVPGVILLAVFGIGVWRESRRFGLGLILCLAVVELGGALTLTIVDAISRSISEEVGAFGLLLVLILLVLGIAVLAFVSVLREGLEYVLFLSALAAAGAP